MRAAPNNSFNRSANSITFIENLRVSAVRRARLIRALGGGGQREIKVRVKLKAESVMPISATKFQ
jgi:hypothetical protein